MSSLGDELSKWEFRVGADLSSCKVLLFLMQSERKLQGGDGIRQEFLGAKMMGAWQRTEGKKALGFPCSGELAFARL